MEGKLISKNSQLKWTNLIWSNQKINRQRNGFCFAKQTEFRWNLYQNLTKSKRKLSFETDDDTVDDGIDPDINQGFVEDKDVDNEIEVGEGIQNQESPMTSNQPSPAKPVEIDIYDKASKTFLKDQNVSKTLARQAAKKGLVGDKTFHKRKESENYEKKN